MTKVVQKPRHNDIQRRGTQFLIDLYEAIARNGGSDADLNYMLSDGVRERMIGKIAALVLNDNRTPLDVAPDLGTGMWVNALEEDGLVERIRASAFSSVSDQIMTGFPNVRIEKPLFLVRTVAFRMPTTTVKVRETITRLTDHPGKALRLATLNEFLAWCAAYEETPDVPVVCLGTVGTDEKGASIVAHLSSKGRTRSLLTESVNSIWSADCRFLVVESGDR